MSTIPWIMILVLILLVVLGLLAIFAIKARKGKHKIDYYSFFWIGLIWVLFGAFSWFRYKTFSGLLAIGLVFLIIGLANKSKWKKNHRTWKDYNAKERRYMFWIVIILGILLLAGGVVFYLVEKGIVG